MSSKTLSQYIEEARKQGQSMQTADVNASNQMYDTQIQTVKDTYGTQIADTEQEYNTLYDENAVQKMINERQIAENMANLGLTDSGLNRTQQTAAQLSYANQNNAIVLQKQKAVDTLAQTMRAQMTQLETDKVAAAQNINSNYESQYRESGTSMYNQQVQAEADKYKADLETQQKASQKLNEMYNEYYGTNGVFNFLRATKKDEYGNDTTNPMYTEQEKANRMMRFLSQYEDVLTYEMIDNFVSNLSPKVQEIVKDEWGIVSFD